MKHLKKIYAAALAGLVLFLLSGGAFADEEIIERGIRRYLRGDYQAAIEDFSRALELEEDEKARQLLVNSLIEEGRNNIERGEYEKAAELLSRADEMSPSQETSDLLEEARKQAGLLEEEEAEEEEEPREAQPSPELTELRNALRRERQAAAALRNRLGAAEKQRDELNDSLEDARQEILSFEEKISQLEEKDSQRQGRFFKIGLILAFAAFVLGAVLLIFIRRTYVAASSGSYLVEELEEKISARLKEAEEDAEDLEEKVARSINQMVDGQKDMIKQISLSSGGRTQQDIEEIKDSFQKYFENQQQRLLDLLQQQAMALSKEKTEKIELPSGRVITDVNPQVRARADSVELIPKTVSDPKVAEKMLKAYLSDPSNRVRANAAREINRYNPELA
ncbi:MAG: bacterial transcriptional activator domain-containing protein, partial [Elusimicrobiota bacterium]